MNQLTDKRVAEILARAEICDDTVLTDYADIVLTMLELQEHRKAAGATQNGRSSAKVQVQSIDHVYVESPSGMNAALVNDVTAGKQLTITLPDVSSKAFWSGTSRHEVFHPETYKRWAKEAIERDCTIAKINVKVK